MQISRREQIESAIKKLEDAIDDCTFTDINIIKEVLDLGWYEYAFSLNKPASAITKEDRKRLYDLGDKFHKNCDCWIRRYKL